MKRKKLFFSNSICLLAACLAGVAHAAAPDAQTLPEPVAAALAQARIGAESVSFLVADVDGKTAPRLSHRADAVMNPASVMKLVTTVAGLDLLGPAYVWRTPVWLDGTVSGAVFKGNLVLQGQGDPKLVAERLWLLLARLQAQGIRRIEGDIVLDRSAFALTDTHPAEFDGEPFRPYNVAPDALAINFKSLAITFWPDPANRVARISYDLPLAGVALPSQVPLADAALPCGDYRAALKADFADPLRVRFAGAYPPACGEKTWPVAYADPASFNARSIEGLWLALGGSLSGRVREARAPALPASFELSSAPLAEVIRDINKFSNNLMAQQLFLTLAWPAPGSDSAPGSMRLPATREQARLRVTQWWQQRVGAALPLTLDNGAGLSRQERITAQGLGQLLRLAWSSPFMPELLASLPIVGVDGTLRRSQARPGSAHLKSGSLRDVAARAGYVHLPGGQRLLLVAMINHPNALAARPVFEALLDWALRDNGGL